MEDNADYGLTTFVVLHCLMTGCPYLCLLSTPAQLAAIIGPGESLNGLFIAT